LEGDDEAYSCKEWLFRIILSVSGKGKGGLAVKKGKKGEK